MVTCHLDCVTLLDTEYVGVEARYVHAVAARNSDNATSVLLRCVSKRWRVIVASESAAERLATRIVDTHCRRVMWIWLAADTRAIRLALIQAARQ